MLRPYIKFTFVLPIFIFFLPINIIYAQNRFNEEISGELSAFVEKRKSLIVSEAKEKKDDEWSGMYSSILGTTVSFSLFWSPDAGFVSSLFNCSRPWTERVNYGKAEFKNNFLTIYPELAKDKASAYSFGADEMKFVPVKWGEQHFLIEPEKLVNFAYSANYNSEIESYLIKSDDYGKPQNGLPDLPKQYHKYLKMKPIFANIIKTDKNVDIYDRKITINVGQADGVIEGMYFYSKNLKNTYAKIYINSVAEKTSEASIAFLAGEEEGIQAEIGWKFTSKQPKSGGYSP